MRKLSYCMTETLLGQKQKSKTVTERKEPEVKTQRVKTSENFVEDKNVRRRYFRRFFRR